MITFSDSFRHFEFPDDQVNNCVLTKCVISRTHIKRQKTEIKHTQTLQHILGLSTSSMAKNSTPSSSKRYLRYTLFVNIKVFFYFICRSTVVCYYKLEHQQRRVKSSFRRQFEGFQLKNGLRKLKTAL